MPKIKSQHLAISTQPSIPEIGGDSRLEESLLVSMPKQSNGRTHVLKAFVETPWAILPRQLIILEEIVVRHVSGEKLDADEVQTRTHGAQRPSTDRRVSTVAVLPLFGTIFPRVTHHPSPLQRSTDVKK